VTPTHARFAVAVKRIEGKGLRLAGPPARLLLMLRQEGVMQTLVEIGTMVTGIAVALVAGRLVLQGILVATFGRRG
jgi:hypothetical protein